MADWLDSFADPTQQDILRAQIQALRQRNNPEDIGRQSRAAALMGAFDAPGIQKMGGMLGQEAAQRESETTPRLMGALQNIRQQADIRGLGGLSPEAAKAQAEQTRAKAALESVQKFMPVPPGYKMGNVRTGQTVGGSAGSEDPIAANVEGIISGTLPPDLKGNNRMGPLIKAGLAARGFDLAKAQNEWTATQHHLATMNGQQQTRLAQAVDFSYHSLDNIEQLYNQWKQVGAASGVRLFNRVSLAASKQLPGQAGATAQALEAAIHDWVGEYANVLMGGNSPTDQAIKLAAHNMSSDWNEETMMRGLQLARTTLGMRKNAMAHSMTAGVGMEGSRYEAPAQPAAAAPQAAPVSPAGPRPHRTVNGETREWDGKQWVPIGK